MRGKDKNRKAPGKESFNFSK